jgi:hypothetical protein
MQYMLAVYGDERAGESMPREQMTEIVNAYMAYTEALRDAKPSWPIPRLCATPRYWLGPTG